MAKTLILAKTGFGKSSSLVGVPSAGILGLNPKETYLLSCVNKPLPIKGASKIYVPVSMQGVTPANLGSVIGKGNRIITKDAKIVAAAIELLINSPFKNIVIDDMNYLSQDYYMKNAMKGGWDTPKQIGYNMGLIFDQIDNVPEDKNIICMAHFETYKDKNGDSISYKYKSTGNMVDEYITPEGKFETVLFGKMSWDDTAKVAVRQFVTNNDGEYPAKSPVGMFESLYIPNDLGIVAQKMQEYYEGE